MPSHKQPSKHEQSSSADPLESMLHDNWASAMLSPVIIIFLYSLVQLILHLVWLDGSIGHYIFMLVASIVSYICISMYTRTFFHSRKQELLAAPSMTIAYALVFLFACYITFYQGFWGFAELGKGFSIWVILKSIVAIYLGYKLAKTTSEISDEVKNAKQV